MAALRLSVTDPSGGTTLSTYDKRDNLTAVIDPNGNTMTYAYYGSNRLATISSPDTGLTTYTYDANGNLLTKTDAQGNTVTYQYDEMNRITQMIFDDPMENLSYTYDTCQNGIGRICGTSDPSGTTGYAYNSAGKVVSETKVIEGTTYVTEYGYDLSGNPTSIIYPSGRVVTYAYENSKLTSVSSDSSPVASDITYKPFGGMATIAYGNGLFQSTGYDQRYRINSIEYNDAPYLSLAYDYNGNITGITNYFNPG